MKNVLIAGANSYIGTNFECLMVYYFNKYKADTLDLIGDGWKEKDLSGYDAIFHVAGIAHIKETEENAHLYYEVNRDLAYEVAKKAKAEGVKQFIFLSSMSVYGINTGVITKDTKPNPTSNYGKSKLQAEEKLMTLSDESFSVAILRPPMVYGRDCKGNFQSIVKIVSKSPVFPKVKNQRSMIYIDNLTSFVKLCIDKNLSGIFFPQNSEYVNTSDMAKAVAKKMKKKVWMSSLAGFMVKPLIPHVPLVEKAFGSLIYKDTEDFDFSYCVVGNEESFGRSI